jgi:ADP-ribose pyrophosphatase
VPLPRLPRIHLEVVEQRHASEPGFLSLQRPRIVARYPGGAESEPFVYDLVRRRALDAVVMAAHFVRDGERHVYLRSAVRPPLALRPIPPLHDGALWELPAGLIDEGESPAEAAAREIEEELGLTVPASALRELGPWTFPAPGIIAEQHFYFHVEVDPKAQKSPSEDGSPLEREASVVALSLREAIGACATGQIRDAKTELALRRLAETA